MIKFGNFELLYLVLEATNLSKRSREHRINKAQNKGQFLSNYLVEHKIHKIARPSLANNIYLVGPH